MKKTGILIAIMMLSACTEASMKANQVYDASRRGVYNTAAKVQSWMRYTPENKMMQAPETRYCYKAMTDIICYETEQPHISNKLVGYQGYAPANMPSHAVNFGAAMPVAEQEGPFYVNHSPYRNDAGDMTTSSRVHIAKGEIMIKDTMNHSSSSASTKASSEVSTRSPQKLMPRY